MPYEYRKLSPKEREEIVNDRREHNYPLHAPPHLLRNAGAYLISATNFEHRPIKSSPNRRTEFETQLLNSIKEITEDLFAWVVLPNHYHVLVGIQSLDNLSVTLKHLLRNNSHFKVACNYIHYNPVKHGYVSDSYDWSWSSLQMHYEDRGKNFLQEEWHAYKPPNDFGKGWDDDIKND
jgi:putative transposase